MFDLYTESARRAIFGARLAAEGSKRIEVDHLLAGIANVEPCFKESALAPDLQLGEAKRPAVANDMGLSYAAKRVLAYAAEEGAQPHGEINCLHLALGILREGKSEAARLLAENGFTREAILARLPPAPPLPPRSWLQANQHVAVFLFGFAVWLAIEGYMAWEMKGVPWQEHGYRLLDLYVLLVWPLFTAAVSFCVAIIPSLVGFGFRSGGRFTARSRVLVPLACVAVYLLHRLSYRLFRLE